MLYTALKHKSKYIKDLIKIGVVDPVWIRNIEIFERYQVLRKDDVCRQCCEIIIADEFGVSTHTVQKVVLKLGK